MSNIILSRLYRQFDDLYHGVPWLDESFSKKLNYIQEADVFKRPIPQIKSIGEIVSHLIEWRKEILERVKGKQQISLTMESVNNWLPLETLRQNGWEKLKEDFADTQEQIYELLSEKEDSFLDQQFSLGQEKYTYGEYLEGLLHHDIYHLGQIGIVIKLLKQ